MTYKSKLKISIISLFVLLAIWLVPLIFKIQINEYLMGVINFAIAIAIVFVGYYGASIQLEKGNKRSALAVMFVTGYIFCRILEVVINLFL